MYAELRLDLATTLNALRRERGLTQVALADEAAISLSYWRALEQGRSKRPSAETLDPVLRVLGVDSDERRRLHLMAHNYDFVRELDAAEQPPTRDTLRRHLTPMMRAELDADTSSTALAYLDQRWCVLEANTTFAAVFPGAAGAASWIDWFFRPDTRALFANWDDAAAAVAATLRRGLGPLRHLPWACKWLARLSVDSPDFHRHWTAPAAAAGTATLETQLLRTGSAGSIWLETWTVLRDPLVLRLAGEIQHLPGL